MRLRMSDAIKCESKPSLGDLRQLYRQNVDGRISDEALSIFKYAELRRHISVCLYRNWNKGKNRMLVVRKISDTLGVSVSSVEKWCPAKKKPLISKGLTHTF